MDLQERIMVEATQQLKALLLSLDKLVEGGSQPPIAPV